eukprot:m.191895 g.191895  ORF g.191895 m.191895 type:complete len:195 (+) comp39456_c0_seq8:293-877(+)
MMASEMESPSGSTEFLNKEDMANEVLLSKTASSVMSRLVDGHKSDTFLVGLGITVVLVLTAVPLFFYAWRPTEKDTNANSFSFEIGSQNFSATNSNHSNSSCTRFSAKRLLLSICSSYLRISPDEFLEEGSGSNPKGQLQEETVKLEEIWKPGCTFSKVEKGLRRLFSLLSLTRLLRESEAVTLPYTIQRLWRR